MTATSHSIIGTVIAAKIGNPALAIPLAVASHIVMDLVPHWDTATNRNEKSRKRLFIDSFVDALLAISVSYSVLIFLFPKTNLHYAVLIIFFSLLPDILMSPYLFFKIKEFKWAYNFGKMTNRELDKPWGVITQMVAVTIIVILGKIL